MRQVLWPNLILACSSLQLACAASADESVETNSTARLETQAWNWHVQNTVIVQGYPAFPANYSGPNSLHPGGQIRDTISLDLLGWRFKLWLGGRHRDLLRHSGLENHPRSN
jgi:high affinity Mn2+ porin